MEGNPTPESLPALSVHLWDFLTIATELHPALTYDRRKERDYAGERSSRIGCASLLR